MRRTFIVPIDGLDRPFEIVADPSEEDLLDARQRALLRVWRKALHNRGTPPALGDLERVRIEELNPHLMLLAVQNDGDLVYLRYGTAVQAAYGGDVTGRRASEFPTPVGKVFLSIYRLGLKTRLAYATRHKPPPPVRDGHWHRLILPVDEARKGSVDHFLACNVAVDG
jgi:hypothetical protein